MWEVSNSHMKNFCIVLGNDENLIFLKHYPDKLQASVYYCYLNLTKLPLCLYLTLDHRVVTYNRFIFQQSLVTVMEGTDKLCHPADQSVRSDVKGNMCPGLKVVLLDKILSHILNMSPHESSSIG